MEINFDYKLVHKDVRHVSDRRLNLIASKKLGDDGYISVLSGGV